MCGIVGYIGKKEALPFLLEGLKKVEYRGYDSSGLVVLKEKAKCVKAAGKLEKLEEKTKKETIKGNFGIGHSRWSTHGPPTTKNAHPHSDCKNNIFVVHNGIIENYKEIKEELEKKGHKFVSQTDTEVLSHLIEEFFQGNLEEAVIKALGKVRGTYALAAVALQDPGKIVAGRMFSPLAISVNKEGGFVTSDPAAIVSYSKKMIFLEDGDVAVIKGEDFFIKNLKNKLKEREETKIDWDTKEAQKGGEPHFMLKEIKEQPESVANSFRGRLIEEEGTAKLGGIESVEKKLRKIEKIRIISCGTSYYAGLIGKYMLEDYAGIPTEVDLGSEFYLPKIDKKTAFLFISQSGETADTLSALKEVKNKGGLSLGIVNAVGSSIARETDAGIYNHAGPEIGVASTKAFTSQVVVLSLLTLFLGRQRNMDIDTGKKFAKEIKSLPFLIGKILENMEGVSKLAKKYKSYPNFLYLGRRYNYPVAMEGALKLKEISYIHAEGNAGGEIKHGPLALIDKDFPVFAICLSDGVYGKMISGIHEIKARGGKVIALATQGNKEIEKIASDTIFIPKEVKILSPVLAVIPLQIFAYYVAVFLKKDPDKPRNLAKSVTVE